MSGAAVDVRSSATGRPGHGRAGDHAFRGDIEGMRSIAVLLVVLYHAGVPAVSGGYVGVDVFFVLSGFLITGLLVSELERTGRISLPRFYARRARRLLPLAATVLLATTLVATVVLPPLDVPALGSDVLAAALYVANWYYAVGSTDYLGGAGDTSPFLHFWSLAVEEQFYVVWPLLMSAVVVGARSTASLRRRLAWGVGLLGGASFGLSAVLTPVSGAWAYYGLHTRAWELAAGAALALAAPRLARLPQVAAGVMGWCGLVLVVASGLLLDEATVFPGTAAALPVLGAVLLVASGARPRARGTAVLLAARPLRYVGRVSYAWYLWHWPCLVLARAMVDGVLTPAGTAVAVLVSFLLAVLSHAVVEEPVRRSGRLAASTGVSLRLGAALTAVGVAVAATTAPWTAWGSPRGDVVALDVLEGTALGPSGDEDWEGRPLMSALEARRDQVRPAGCYASFPEEVPPPAAECWSGPRDAPVTVALLGDSHAAHWLPALQALAAERGWAVVFYGKSACPPFDVRVWSDQLQRPYDECARWRDNVEERLAALGGVDVALLARSQVHVGTPVDDGERVDVLTRPDVWTDGADRTFAALDGLADRVVVLEDTPWAPFDVPACLSEQAEGDPDPCSFERVGRVNNDEPLAEAERAAEHATGVRWLDVTDRLCPGDDRCPVVAANGGVIYGDSSHMTNSFSRSAGRLLGDGLADLDDPGPLGGR